jgi:hypothetical protein
MAHKIDTDRLDLCHYVSEKDNDLGWWFDWCKDEDPLTFWERRYEKRRSVHRRPDSKQNKESNFLEQ